MLLPAHPQVAQVRRAAFPDVRSTISDMVSEDDKVADNAELLEQLRAMPTR